MLHVHLACVRLTSDVHAIAVSSVEDPEKMLEQTVNEMQTDLIKMRQASAQVSLALHAAHMELSMSSCNYSRIVNLSDEGCCLGLQLTAAEARG